MRTDDRPGLAEQIGTAVNADSLESVPGRETPLDRVAALGLASKAMGEQAATKAQQIAAMLSPNLWRARYGDDRTARAIATEDFADWLCAQHPYWDEIDRALPGLAYNFALRVMKEWTKLKCKACGGGGKQQQLRGGKRVRPGDAGRGALVRCLHCQGTGRQKINEQDRRRALEPAGHRVKGDEYARFWRREYRDAFTALADMVGEQHPHLRRLLDRDKVAP